VSEYKSLSHVITFSGFFVCLSAFSLGVDRAKQENRRKCKVQFEKEGIGGRLFWIRPQMINPSKCTLQQIKPSYAKSFMGLRGLGN
jgi:hypothetical protein